MRRAGSLRWQHSRATSHRSPISARTPRIAATSPGRFCARRCSKSEARLPRPLGSSDFGRQPMPPLDQLTGADAATRIVRVPTVHDSAERHVRGTATYVDDIREPEGTLHVAPGGAPAAHGRIKRLTLEAVRAAPGVLRVLTAVDIPGRNDCSPVKGDDPIFAERGVEFCG